MNQGNLNVQSQSTILQQLLGVSNAAQAAKAPQPPLAADPRQPSIAAKQGGQPSLQEAQSQQLLRSYMAPAKKDGNSAAIQIPNNIM